MKRKNLHVLLHSRVSRVINIGTDNGEPVFRSVEFQGAIGRLTRVLARREVILSAGAINTPQILLNSGIGDSATLEALGIMSLVHNPSVGANLSDHLLVGNRWNVASNETFEAFTSNATATQALVDEWEKARTGVLASGSFNNIGWVRFAENSSILQDFPDSSSGPTSPHVELLISVGIRNLGGPGELIIKDWSLRMGSAGRPSLHRVTFWLFQWCSSAQPHVSLLYSKLTSYYST